MDHWNRTDLAPDWSAFLRGEGLKEARLGDFLPGVRPRTLHNALAIFRAGDQIECVDRRHYKVTAPRKLHPALVYHNHQTWKCKDCSGKTAEDPCSHILAVLLQVQDDLLPEPEEVTFKGDGGRDWKVLQRAAQAFPSLFPKYAWALASVVQDDPYTGVGRPKARKQDLVFSALVWVAAGCSMEQARGLLQTPAYLAYCPEPCSAASICGFLNDSATVELLDELLLVSAAPMAPYEDTLLVDGTGYASTQFFAYNDARHGNKEKPRQHRWIKAIPVMAYESCVVPAVAVAGPHAAENPYFLPLLERARTVFQVKSVAADKAYSTKLNYFYGETLGIDVQVPVKSNANPNASNPGRTNKAYRRKMHEFQVDPIGHQRKYGRRNAVESLMHAVKRREREYVRCRNEEAQKNEVRIKFLIHNLTQLVKQRYVNDMVPDFQAEAFRIRQRTWTPLQALKEQFSGKRAEQAVMALA